MTVWNSTFASSGRLSMYSTDLPTICTSITGSTTDDKKTFAQAYKEADDRMYEDKRSRRR